VNRDLHRTLKQLREDQDIKMCKFDKGNGVVVLNSEDYFRKLETLYLIHQNFDPSQPVEISSCHFQRKPHYQISE